MRPRRAPSRRREAAAATLRAAALLSAAPLLLVLAACGERRAADVAGGPGVPHNASESASAADAAPSREIPPVSDRVEKSEAEWKRILTPQQYHVLREKGTERAFTGAYWDTKTPGTYRCAGCGAELFTSDMKFDSGCGWPSFDRELPGGRVVRTEDRSFGMLRVEITCARCGGHLGHVFDDGPTDTGERYCVNSVSVELVPKPGAAKAD